MRPQIFWMNMVILITVSVIHGCASRTSLKFQVQKVYLGAELPRDNIAKLTRRGDAFLKSLNGAYVAVNDTLELLPGKHWISVWLSWVPWGTRIIKTSKGSFVLNFEAKPGHEYMVLGVVTSEKSWVIELRDVTTNQTVTSFNQNVLVEDHMGLRIRDQGGYWRYIMPKAKNPVIHISDGKIKDLFAIGGVVTISEFKDLRIPLPSDTTTYQRYLNDRGIAIMSDDGRPLPNQGIPLSKKPGGPTAGWLYAIEGNNIVRLLLEDELFVDKGSGKAVKLIGLSQAEIDKLSGIAQDIASTFAQREITGIETANLLFTNALDGQLIANIIAYDKTKTKHSLFFGKPVLKPENTTEK